jgi:ParB family chromosome partitioning protein
MNDFPAHTFSRKPKGLGRGLSVLLESGITNVKPSEESGESEIAYFNPSQIHRGIYQPRKTFDEDALRELAQSIKSYGVLLPLLVRYSEKGDVELIAGERRLRAAEIAGLDEVPCRILKVSGTQAREMGLLENVQRKDLSPIEEAGGYQKLLEEGHYTQEQLAEKIGKSRTHVTNTLRLLNLPPDVQILMNQGSLSAGHGRALLGASDPLDLAQKVISKAWSVRQIEEHLKRRKRDALPENHVFSEGAMHQDERILEQQLGELVGLSVNIHLNPRSQSGTVQFKFSSPQQLDCFLQNLSQAYLDKPSDKQE